MQILEKFLFLLSKRERKNALLLLVMIIMMALIDTLGVASILPFIAVLLNPNIVETSTIFKQLFTISKIFGVENIQQFLLFFGILVFLILLISLLVRVVTIYSQVKFVENLHYKKSLGIIEKYLHQPYHWFLNQNSAEIGTTILAEIGMVVGNGIAQLLEITAKGSIVIGLVILLIIIDPKLAIIVGLTIGGAYVIIFFTLKNYLNRIGKERLENNETRFKIIHEAFSSIKHLKLGGLEKFYIDNFDKAAKNFAKVSSSADAIKQLPRYFLETLVFGGILLLILFLMLKNGSFVNSLPIISLYAFAGYRVMPALQQVYASLTILNFTYPSLEKLHKIIESFEEFNQTQDRGILTFNDSIVLKNINYNYPNSSIKVLKNININIPSKSTVGIIGPTGSGKTTIVDIILGLLELQDGKLEIDGKIITRQNLRSWQSIIGYVPQNIYLSDNTVAANIAIGQDPKNYNYDSIIKASKIANLHQLVSDELPKQYQTIIGENGVRLSGGQRQRIGIARALYNNPKVLVFDEATSALDNDTENAVMDAVSNLDKSMTIILIAHRLNTVKSCDIIFKLDKGNIVAKGKFSEVIITNV